MTTLAARTLGSVPFDESVVERTFITSLIARWALDDFTAISDVGPIMVGVAHSDYSDAEVEEFIENTGSWDEGNLVQQKEIGRRLIKIVGVFVSGGQPTGLISDVLNNGKAMKTKLGWILTTGDTLTLWGYNLGSANVATSVPNVYCQGHANLWPQ